MKKSEVDSLFTPQRQSIIAIMIILIKFVRVMARQLWPILLILLVNRNNKTQIYIGIAVAVISGISLVGSIIAYFKYYFFIRNEELIVEKGVLRRTKLNVPFERIQSVNFEQNIIHQIFKVVSVKIDTAGSKGSELNIDAISKEKAEALRDFIMKQKAEMAPASHEQFDQVYEEEKELVLSLNPIDLIKIGVSQNHLRTAAIILAFFLGVADDLEQANFDVFDQIEQNLGSAAEFGLLLVLIAIPVFIFISFMITLVRTVFKYWDLKFYKTISGFKLISGLFTREEKTIQKKKVQMISWTTNPIKQIFGIYRLYLNQAASVEVQQTKNMVIPGAYNHQVKSTVASVMPQSVSAEYQRFGIHPLAKLRMIFFIGILPCLVGTGIAYFAENNSFYWIWLYFPLALWMSHLYFKKRALQIHPELLISESGIFGRRFRIIEVFKVQAVKVTQTWYENRKNLSTIHIYTAGGAVSVPMIPLKLARALGDYVLYRAEREKKSWM